jgi:hypothetical protein
MDIKNVLNKSRATFENDILRQLPLALREFASPNDNKFDAGYDNRSLDEYLQYFSSVKYPIQDTNFGSPNSVVCNIFLNQLNFTNVDDIIEEFIENKLWVYHPVRSFEKWHNISELYYSEQRYYWVLLLFNRITDPFQALKDLNIIRVPFTSFVSQLKNRFNFNFSNSQDINL